jgi:hypothetical protein
MHCDVPQADDLPPRFDQYQLYLKSLPRKVRRGLQRQWKRSPAEIALMLALGMAPALAATINVEVRAHRPREPSVLKPAAHGRR